MKYRYYFTKHVLSRMRLRLITERQVVDCIENPQVSQKEGAVQIAKKIQKDRRLLMVIYDHKTNNIVSIITAIKTSKIHKYL
ncbi:MAG: DUF4258 domain-containing protein [Patescibacteria group bacterium]